MSQNAVICWVTACNTGGKFLESLKNEGKKSTTFANKSPHLIASTIWHGYQPAIDAKKASGRENDLRCDKAYCMSLDAKCSPKTVGYEEQDEPPTRKFVVQCQE